MNRGFGEALAQAFEFAAIPVLFAAFGWWLDDLLGISPALLVALATLGFVGVCLRTVFPYLGKAKKEEEGTPCPRAPRKGDESPSTPPATGSSSRPSSWSSRVCYEESTEL